MKGGFLYVPSNEIFEQAKKYGATLYDLAGVGFTNVVYRIIFKTTMKCCSRIS